MKVEHIQGNFSSALRRNKHAFQIDDQNICCTSRSIISSEIEEDIMYRLKVG